jgi:hypothetical protein
VDASTRYSPPHVAAAEEIIKSTGITEGWCVDLGCDDARLALELARRTKLNIVAIEPDAQRVAQARQRLDETGFYGTRVTVYQGSPADPPCPDFFANLIVSGQSIMGVAPSIPARQIRRMQHPFGGTMIVGKPGAMRTNVRESLPGAGEWTHQ